MDADDIASRTGASNQLFNVVYDPNYDRFFLEDEALHHERSRSLERKGISMPSEKWIVPPKLVTKTDEKGNTKDPKLPQRKNDHVAFAVPPAITENSRETSQFDHSTAVPASDFSSFQQPLTEASPEIVKTIPIDPAVTIKPKKTGVQDYTTHFKKTNQEMARVVAAGAANAEPSDDHEVKWNGEVIRVQVPGLRTEIESFPGKDSDNQAALRGEVVHLTDDQWPGSTYELKNLMRIRAHADGLRGVNTACRFVAVSSSESSESEEEQEVPQYQESEDDNLMPVFFRDDRVLFHAKQRWFKGTVRRRIPSSDFYNIRGDNGTLFEAVLASKMELLDEPEEPPYYHYRRGDKVLWVPDIKHTATTSNSRRQQENNISDEELTYKVKIVQVRSLNRFDLLLRTGRVVKKVPHEQLRPRDVSDFVSTTVSRRR